MDEVGSAGSCSEFGHNIKEILSTDDNHRFVLFLASSSENYNRFQSCVSTILQWICSSNAVNCAAALLEGETGLKVDLNQPVLGGYYPLHLAARNLFPRLVELFIFHGAQTNVRCKGDVEDEDSWYFPFQLGLRAASNHECLKGWASGQYAIFKLIIKLCLPEMKDALDTIKPLVSGTLAVQGLVHYYVTEGILAELAVLAMVALEEVLKPMPFSVEDTGRKQIQMLKKEVMSTRSANLMLEIFERAGDDIEMLKEKMAKGVPIMKVVKYFSIRLSEAGFDFRPKDNALRNILRGSMREPIKMVLEQSECGIQQLGLQLPSQRTQIGPWHTSDVMPFLKPIPRQTQSSPFGERSIHTSRLCKSIFISKYSTITVDVEVKESMKAIEQRVPKLLSSEKWAYFALVIKRGIRRA